MRIDAESLQRSPARATQVHVLQLDLDVALVAAEVEQAAGRLSFQCQPWPRRRRASTACRP